MSYVYLVKEGYWHGNSWILRACDSEKIALAYVKRFIAAQVKTRGKYSPVSKNKWLNSDKKLFMQICKMRIHTAVGEI